MELDVDQRQAILDSLQKLYALSRVIGYICEDGVPGKGVFRGWELLLLGIEMEIHQIIEPETAND